MDSITQAVLGATIQGAMLGRAQGRRALVYGAILGTLPDLDVLISYPDPVSSMTFHRGFSHSLIVLSGFSILLAWLVSKIRPSPHYSPARLLLAIWLVLTTHTLLDAFTSYGTQLLWPFMPTPAAWSTIFIVDPAYTVPMALVTLTGLLFGVGRAMQRWLRGALALSTAYLAFTVGGKLVIEQRAREALAQHDVEVSAVFSGTAPLNSLLWRVIAKDNAGDYHEGFIGLLDQGEPSFVRLPLNGELAANLRASTEHARLKWFTGDWLRYDVIGDRLVVTDLRMGMTGHHFFRFVMAHREAGQWQAIVPYDWHGPWMDRQLGLLWSRVWDESVQLPLARWDERMTAPAPAAAQE